VVELGSMIGGGLGGMIGGGLGATFAGGGWRCWVV
jgi:hypothetical protein